MARTGPYFTEDKWWGGGLYSLNPNYETAVGPKRYSNVPYPIIVEFFITDKEKERLGVFCK